MTASPPAVMAGDSVTFSASRIGATLTAVERWVWKPLDTSQPAKTVACSTTSVTCRVPVYEDGWLFAHVMIDGYLHTHWAGVNVTDEIKVECKPVGGSVGQAVTRGTDVVCTGRLRSGRQFEVVKSRALTADFGILPVSGDMSGDGTTWTSSGPAATGTSVYVRWKSGHEMGEQPGAFSVAPRDSFPDPQFPEPASFQTADLGGQRADGPRFRLGEVDPEFAVHPIKLDTATVPVERGPNQGLSFLTRVPLAEPVIRLNTVMFTPGTHWYEDQNGIGGRDPADPSYFDPVTGARYCTPNQIPNIRNAALAHEGKPISRNSHIGIWNDSLDIGNTGREFETFVFRTDTEKAQLWLDLNAKVLTILTRYTRAQDLFELWWWTHHAEPTLVGCAIDMNANDQ